MANLDFKKLNLTLGGGTGGGPAIIDVDSLPTENIKEDVFYRLKEAARTFKVTDAYVMFGGQKNDFSGTPVTVEQYDDYAALPETPDAFDTSLTDVKFYYIKTPYTTEEIVADGLTIPATTTNWLIGMSTSVMEEDLTYFPAIPTLEIFISLEPGLSGLTLEEVNDPAEATGQVTVYFVQEGEWVEAEGIVDAYILANGEKNNSDGATVTVEIVPELPESGISFINIASGMVGSGPLYVCENDLEWYVYLDDQCLAAIEAQFGASLSSNWMTVLDFFRALAGEDIPEEMLQAMVVKISDPAEATLPDVTYLVTITGDKTKYTLYHYKEEWREPGSAGGIIDVKSLPSNPDPNAFYRVVGGSGGTARAILFEDGNPAGVMAAIMCEYNQIPQPPESTLYALPEPVPVASAINSGTTVMSRWLTSLDGSTLIAFDELYGALIVESGGVCEEVSGPADITPPSTGVAIYFYYPEPGGKIYHYSNKKWVEVGSGQKLDANQINAMVKHPVTEIPVAGNSYSPTQGIVWASSGTYVSGTAGMYALHTDNTKNVSFVQIPEYDGSYEFGEEQELVARKTYTTWQDLMRDLEDKDVFKIQLTGSFVINNTEDGTSRTVTLDKKPVLCNLTKYSTAKQTWLAITLFDNEQRIDFSLCCEYTDEDPEGYVVIGEGMIDGVEDTSAYRYGENATSMKIYYFIEKM